MSNDKGIEDSINGQTRAIKAGAATRPRTTERCTMKEQKWDDSFEDSKDFVEVTVLLPEEEEEEELRVKPSSDKSRVTELRRRIEERLDCKRIDLEFDYDDELDELDALDDLREFDELDEYAESLQ